MSPVLILLGIIVCTALAFLGMYLLEYFSSERRAVRNGVKSDKKVLLAKTQQLNVARKALIKIAANDSGNPSLDANIALEDIQGIEMKELNS